MKNLILILSFFTLLTTFIGCKEDKYGPIENDGVAPSPILSAEAESLPGAVKITYSLPNDEDLLYVMATYTNKQGRVFETKASYYTNSMVLEGFGDTDSYEVKIYAVDRGENKSQPYSINVNCLTPSIIDAFKSLKIVGTFGGINIQTLNKSKADLALVLLRKDSLGFYIIDNTYYTKRDSILIKARGYDSLMTSFAIYVRDRWNNRSDTLFTDIKPIYETKLDKTKFKVVTLPGDARVGHSLPMPGMWDGIVTPDGNNGSMWHANSDLPMPLRITFDLGVTAKLSRFKLFQRLGVYLYNHGNPKIYEVYGSNNPDVDGGWNNWVKLSSCVSKKPSGSPTGVITDEDLAAGIAGEEWEVPLDLPKFRYIRVKIYQIWSGGIEAHIAEMDFYGNPL